jgi:hypothetical protein
MTTTSARSKATDRPRSWRRGRNSTRVPQYSADRIKETNPRRVDLLWRQVMAPKVSKNPPPKAPPRSRATRSSGLGEEVQSNKPTLPFQDEIQTSPSVTQVSTTRTSKSESDKNATARDVDFEETQLIPRGIEIQKARDPSVGYLAGAHAYFDSKIPPNPAESRQFYRGIVQEILAGRVERDINDSIFLSMDNIFIQSVHRAYRILGEAGLPEAEFNAYACQNLFIGQYDILESDATRQLSAVRSLQWSLKPRQFDEHVWHTPPLLSPNNSPAKPYDFDIYPDCQFWLCDKILNADYREAVSQLVHCKALDTFCPYFSIEFKAKLESTRIVVNQVVAAGSVSLFNRYQLKLHAYPHPNQEQLELVRHFGLTMEKEKWIVWHFVPKTVDGAWTGCRAIYLDGGNCRTEQGVRRLPQWINEIHRWGLCEYALGCEDDIKHILSRAPNNVRVSGVGIGGPV